LAAFAKDAAWTTSPCGELLRDYVRGRPPEQDEDSIIQVPRDHEGLISLFCLVARKR
jgi:hypothetical protein